MATVLIADDEREIADLIEVYLQNEGYTVRKFYDAPEILEAPLSDVDIAVLDVMMPQMDGFTLLRKLREKGHAFPIIMLTARDASADKINGLALGADDYVVKPFDPLELMARIKAQLRRSRVYTTPVPEDVYEINGMIVNEKAHTCSVYGKEIDLTPTEFSILLLLCQNRGEVISSERMFEAIWKEKYLESNNTVMVHMQKLRKKLGDTGKRKKFIQTVWGVGYKIE